MSVVRFYLVRHGVAEPRGPAGDAARRLSADGRRQFEAHARALVADMAPLRMIATSPFARARETADLLALATGAAVAEEPALRSGASSGRRLLELGRALGAGTALVGHNPEIAEALSLLAGRNVDVPAGAVAAIDADEAGTRVAWVRAPG